MAGRNAGVNIVVPWAVGEAPRKRAGDVAGIYTSIFGGQNYTFEVSKVIGTGTLTGDREGT